MAAAPEEAVAAVAAAPGAEPEEAAVAAEAAPEVAPVAAPEAAPQRAEARAPGTCWPGPRRPQQHHAGCCRSGQPAECSYSD